jgi:hypothetical protein
MITPHKYLDLNTSLINISAYLLKEFKLHRILKYDEVYNFIIKNFGEQAKEILPYSINFLFLLGLLEYHSTIDAFELNEIK